MHLAAGNHEGAQRQGHVHGAVVGDVAESAAVGAAAGGLELVYYLHGPNLGRAAGGAHRNHAGQGVERRLALLELAADGADDVHHVGVVLHAHQLLHLDRAVLGHPADVVAAEVHQHYVLGPLLLVFQELLGQRGVFGGRLAARAGAGDGAGGHLAPASPEQALGAGRNQRYLAQVEVAHVGAGVDAAQRPVEGEGVNPQLGREAHRGHHLKDVAGADVLLALFDHGRVLLWAQVGRKLGGAAAALAGHARQRAAQLALGLVQQLARPRRGRRAVAQGGGHQLQDLAEVVEDRHQLRFDEEQVGRADLVGVGVGQFFVVAHQVIGHVTHRSAPEGRQVVAVLHLAVNGVVKGGQRVVGFHLRAVDGERAALQAKDPARSHADDRVAAPALAGLD